MQSQSKELEEYMNTIFGIGLVFSQLVESKDMMENSTKQAN
jgi:hypothetical protein